VYKDIQDEGAVIQQTRTTARRMLAQKQDFVWNATNTTLKIRSGLVDMYLGYKARINIIYIEAPYNAILFRNSKRKNRFLRISSISWLIILRYRKCGRRRRWCIMLYKFYKEVKTNVWIL